MKSYRFTPIFCLTLAACSGSGVPPTTTVPADPLPTVIDDTLGLLDQSQSSSTGAAALASLSTRSTVAPIGTIDRVDNSLDIGPISGSYAGGDTQVVLSSGGVATILEELPFSALVSVEQASGTELGVFGVSAIDVATGVPGINVTTVGTGTYEGIATVIARDADVAYDLTGTVNVEIDFDEFVVGLTIDNLSGSSVDQSGVTSQVSDVAVIEIERAELLSSNFFAGGTFDVTSTTFSSLSDVAEINHSGRLFGSGGREAGGAFIIDDTSQGNLLLQGGYIGD